MLREVPFIFLVLFMPCASAQSYRVAPAGAIVSESNCYSFEAPAKWKVIDGNPAPLFFDIPKKGKVESLQQLPKGAASLSVVVGREASENPASIDQWMQLRSRAHSFSSVEEIKLPANTSITRAVKVSWTDRDDVDPGERITQTIAVFFVFQGRPFAAYLSFNLNDRRKEGYLTTLTALLESFRPLTNTPGMKGCSGDN